MSRSRVSIYDIDKSLKSDLSESQRAALPRDFFSYKPKLYRNLELPSYVHGYSLGIEYMRNWFVNKFPKDYFKVIHINGKHVLDDWRDFNNYNIKREKPMLAIIPTVEYDYDREAVDLYLGDTNYLLKRSNYQQSFLKDYENMSFLYMQMRAMKMNFTFKVRLNSRSEQLDCYNKMELSHRIGATMHEYINVDFHIPYDIMVSIAIQNKFEVEDIILDKEAKKVYHKIKNIKAFVEYLNKHSDLPIFYKKRAINQHEEFFVKVMNLYTHIACKDKLSLDDGEREGKLDTNFHVEMQATLTMPIPHFFVHFSQQPLTETIKVEERRGLGIYSINNFEIPPENKNGWGRMVVAPYLCEKGEEYVNISEILHGGDMITKVYEYCKSIGISALSFLDIVIYRSDDKYKIIPFRFDQSDEMLYFDSPMSTAEAIDIVIYYDKEFVNARYLELKPELEEKRYSSEGAK